MRERDVLESADRDRDGGSKPNPRLASVEREINDAIEARDLLGREIDSLVGSGLSDSDEDYISPAKASNTVSSLIPVDSTACLSLAGSLGSASTAGTIFILTAPPCVPLRTTPEPASL